MYLAGLEERLKAAKAAVQGEIGVLEWVYRSHANERCFTPMHNAIGSWLDLPGRREQLVPAARLLDSL